MDTGMRARAARGAVNMSLTEFAKAIGVGRNTVIANESGRELKDHEVERMAAVSGFPVEFFTVPDLRAALAGEVPKDADVAPPIWLVVAELSTRLYALEDAAIKQRGAAAVQADPKAAPLHLQDVVRNLQARATRLTREARDVAGGTSR